MAFHKFGIFVLVLGIFFVLLPYIFEISDFVEILFWTILGIILIKLAIFNRDKLRLDK
jgi:hypothetical protein